MSDAERKVWDEEFTRKHKGQDWGCPPVLPYDNSCMDMLHLFLNVMKVACTHAFHLPFQKKRKKGPVRDIMEGLKDKINERMREDFSRKDFGGEGVFSLTGPQVKALLRGGKNGQLLTDLITIMEPYYSLLESDPTAANEEDEGEARGGGGTSAAGAAAIKPAAAGKAPAVAGKAAGKAAGRPVGSGKKKRQNVGKKKVHDVSLPDDDQVEDEVEDEELEAVADAMAGAASSAAAGSGSSPPPVQSAAQAMTHREKVIVMFLSISHLYCFVHDDAKTKASEISVSERLWKAKKASEYGRGMAQAVINLCGNDVRQTYLHDAAYGPATLYTVLGKPYLGSTEGNESAHQVMKKYFKTMTSHSSKRIGDALQLMNLLHLRDMAIKRYSAFAGPTSQSERMGAGDMGRKGSERERKLHDAAIAVSDAHLEAMKAQKTSAKEA